MQLLHLELTSEVRNKNPVKFTFENYVRVTFGNSVIKSCKLDQKVT